jgi:hypothetical protein
MADVNRTLLFTALTAPLLLLGLPVNVHANESPKPPEFVLPPVAGWLHGQCGRHDCNLYQEHAVRDGSYLSKHSTLYAPRIIVEVGARGSRGIVQLTHAPFSLCHSTHGDECSMEVKVGNEIMMFGFGGRGNIEIVAFDRFVTFVGESKSFDIAYLDEKRKQVVIRFNAQVPELRPARLDR